MKTREEVEARLKKYEGVLERLEDNNDLYADELIIAINEMHWVLGIGVHEPAEGKED